MVTISIITPTLNSENYILENLYSIHGQMGRLELEHLIIDGRSTYRTVEIIQEFKRTNKAKIIVLSEKERNMYEAINKGLRLAKGHIWACLNCDDFYAGYPTK